MGTITYKRRKVSGGVAKYYIETDNEIGAHKGSSIKKL
jgi:hypothetical protein